MSYRISLDEIDGCLIVTDGERTVKVERFATDGIREVYGHTVELLDRENAKLRESVRRLMTQRDERLATAEHKSNELSEGVSRHLLCIACLAPTRNAADSIIVRCRDCKHYTDHSINLHPH